MASFTDSVITVFPAGTTVGAYPVSGFPYPDREAPGGIAPTGSPTASAAVASDGTLTITGLAAATDYYLGADVSGWKYIRTRTAASADTTMADATNIVLGTTTGTQVGTATAQKLGFHGATPVIQRAGAAQAAAATTAATNTTPYGFTTAAQADAIVALVNELRAALVQKGIIKGSA